MVNAHTVPQKEFIVRALAGFALPRDIITAFIARWSDTRCTDADIHALDPRFVVLDPDLYAAFRAERERVLSDPNAAPYAEQKARLIALSHDVAFYRGNNQPAEARAVMRQIAEEVGAVGGKSGAGKQTAPDDAGEEIVEIVRTIIDPKESNGGGTETRHSDAEGVRPVAPAGAL